MKVALYGNNIGKENIISMHLLLETLNRNKVEVTVYKPFYEFLSNFLGHKLNVHGAFQYPKDVKNHANIMLSIGGDGTFLDSVTFVQDSGIPIAGINFGRLGFLAKIPIERIETAIAQIVSKQFTIESRTALKVSFNGNPLNDFPYALNDLTIQKRGSSMVSINAYVDDEQVCNYWADGIIIATPTGSTAYSLSVGGPIISPTSNALAISPIAPHNLTIRPLIIPDTNKLKLEVNTRGNQILFSLDSRSVVVTSPISLQVEKAPFHVALVCLYGETYYSTLRNKLMWGIDSRNGQTN